LAEIGSVNKEIESMAKKYREAIAQELPEDLWAE